MSAAALPRSWSYQYVAPPDDGGAAYVTVARAQGEAWGAVLLPLSDGKATVSPTFRGEIVYVPALPYRVTGRDPATAGSLLCRLGVSALDALTAFRGCRPSRIHIVMGTKYVDLQPITGEAAYLVYFGAAGQWPSNGGTD